MEFSKSELPLLFGPFIKSMLSVSQDELSREMLLSKYRLQIFDYIYIRFKILLVSKSIGFFLWGAKKIIAPLIKHWVGGPLPPAVTNLFSRAFQQLKSIYRVWEKQSTGKCLKSNKVFTTQCLALKIKDRT
jgi:hypothetical protein